MRVDHAFRLSSYLTLGLACLCLAVAEHFFLPGVYFFLLTILLLLSLAWFIEGRWSLPISASNLLGVVIGIGAVAWIGYRGYVAGGDAPEGVSLFALMLPFFGPLLMVLLLVKLLRPKQEGDHWSLQGLGLGHVALGCVLATEPLFGLLLAAYFLSAIWHLLIFTCYRQVRRASNNLDSNNLELDWAANTDSLPAAPSIVRALGWSLAILMISVPMYLVFPRKPQSTWNPLSLAGTIANKKAAESKVGFSSEMDLNATGTLEVDDEIAFSVYAENDQGRAKLDLSPDQKWRGSVLDRYETGRWHGSSIAVLRLPRLPFNQGENAVPGKGQAMSLPFHSRQIGYQEMPALRPKQTMMEFHLRLGTIGALFLADHPDIAMESSETFPIQLTKPAAREFPFFTEFQNVLSIGITPPRAELAYRQIVDPPGEREFLWPLSLQWKLVHEYLCDYPGSIHEELTSFTRALLGKLKRDKQSGLTEEDVGPRPVLARPDVTTVVNAEKVARALCLHLASSGEYSYSLDRPRTDLEMDPLLDFLENTKQGHCERFAGALTLMLRSLEIPTRIVKGFRGSESRGEGKYDVRQNQAHAWVEVLITRDGLNGNLTYHWITLDPTPSSGGSPTSSPSLARWFKDKKLTPDALWRDLVVSFQADQQQFLLADFWASFKEMTIGDSHGHSAKRERVVLVITALGGTLLVCGVGLGIYLLGQARVRKQANPVLQPPLTPLYARLLRLLASRGDFHPTATQTPLEFAKKASLFLFSHPAARDHAGVPIQVVNLYYRHRYGGQSIKETETQALEAQLNQVEIALA